MAQTSIFISVRLSNPRRPSLGRFRIDDPEIDVEALEALVEARIAARTGQVYTAGDLEELRRASLRPRLERHHLSHGVLEEMPLVRGKLPPVVPPPPARPVEDDAEEIDDFDDILAPEALQPRDISPSRDLYTSGSSGLKGRLIGLLRWCLRPVLRTSSNLEHVLVELVEEMQRQDRWLGQIAPEARNTAIAAAREPRRLDRSFKTLDERIDRTVDWVGEHQSQMIGQLEGRHETQLHLLHNLVYEFSCARVHRDRLQDQINELRRHLETLEARERTLERLSMDGGDD